MGTGRPGAATNVHTGGIAFCGAVVGRGCGGDVAHVLEAAARQSGAKLVSHELPVVVPSGSTNDNPGPSNGKRQTVGAHPNKRRHAMGLRDRTFHHLCAQSYLSRVDSKQHRFSDSTRQGPFPKYGRPEI